MRKAGVESGGGERRKKKETGGATLLTIVVWAGGYLKRERCTRAGGCPRQIDGARFNNSALCQGGENWKKRKTIK